MTIEATASSVEKANLENVFKKKDKFTPAEIEILNKYHSGFIPLVGGNGDGAKGPVNKFFVNSYEFNYGTGNTSNGSILEAKKIKGKVNDLKTVESIKEYLNISTVENVPSFGAFLREGFCFVDIDDQEQIEKVEELIKNKNEFFDNIPIMRTGYHKKENTKRGYHFPFKIPKDFKYKQQTFTGLFAGGLIGELRLSGYELLKLNGECREFENIGEIRELPIIFHPAKAKVEVSPVLNLSENKNNNLFTLRSILEARKTFTYEQIEKAILFVNDYICAYPLPKNELYKTNVLNKNFSTPAIDILENKNKMLLDDDYLGERQRQALEAVLSQEKGAELHRKLAKFLVEKFQIIKVLGINNKYRHYNYNNGIYTPLNEEKIMTAIDNTHPFSEKEISEIMAKVKRHAVEYNATFDNKNLHPYNNGYINLNEADTPEEVKNLKVHPFTPDIKFFFKIPHDWNPEIENKTECKNFVDTFLKDLACGEQEYITKLFEIGASCLWRSNSVGFGKQAYFLTGSGANGKSTFIKFIKFTIGDNNCSKVSPLDLANKFRQGNLMNKLFNFDDDISNQRFQAEFLKKAVTGEPLTCEKKFQDDFQFNPFCTCVFACNSMPMNDDFAEALGRRLCIIKFKANFSRFSKKRDVNFLSKILQEQMAEYYLLKAVQYLKKMLLSGDSEESPLCGNNVKEYLNANSPLLGFFDEWLEKAKDDIVYYNPEKPLQGIYLDELYKEYEDYCCKEKRISVPRNRFSMEIQNLAHCKTDKETTGLRRRKFIYPD